MWVRQMFSSEFSRIVRRIAMSVLVRSFLIPSVAYTLALAAHKHIDWLLPSWPRLSFFWHSRGRFEERPNRIAHRGKQLLFIRER
jgi:hypothetical protein